MGEIDTQVLHFARLVTATMSTQSLEVFPDGALCDIAVYDLLTKLKAEVLATRSAPTEQKP